MICQIVFLLEVLLFYIISNEKCVVDVVGSGFFWGGFVIFCLVFVVGGGRCGGLMMCAK